MINNCIMSYWHMNKDGIDLVCVMVQAIGSDIELTLYIWQLLFHEDYIYEL